MDLPIYATPDFWSVVAQVNAVLTLAAAIEFRAALTRLPRRLPTLARVCFAVFAVCMITINLSVLVDAINFVGMAAGLPVGAGLDTHMTFAVGMPLITFIVAFLFATLTSAFRSKEA